MIRKAAENVSSTVGTN